MKQAIPKKAKRPTVSQLKKKLDALFSEYIRKFYADKNGYGTCYTCGTKKPWKELQCGHYKSRQYLATRYSEKNCRSQCVGCNIFKNGNIASFAFFLEQEYEYGILQELEQEARKIVKNFPYELKIAEYKEKLATLS